MSVLVRICGALLIGAACVANAQESRSVSLTMAHRHALVESLKDAGVGIQRAPSLEVGSVIPDSIQLAALPTELGNKVPQIREHMYFRTANKIVLVSDKERKVVEVIAIPAR